MATRRDTPPSEMEVRCELRPILQVGRAAYALYSAVAHASVQGLGQAIDLESAREEGLMAIVTRPDDVIGTLNVAILGFLRAADAHRKYVGWVHPAWTDAVENAWQVVKQNVPVLDELLKQRGIDPNTVADEDW